jgi:hypothetical protein
MSLPPDDGAKKEQDKRHLRRQAVRLTDEQATKLKQVISKPPLPKGPKPEVQSRPLPKPPSPRVDPPPPPPPSVEDVTGLMGQFDNPTISEEEYGRLKADKPTQRVRVRNERRNDAATRLLGIAGNESLPQEVRDAAKAGIEKEQIGTWKGVYDYNKQITELSAITQDYEMNKTDFATTMERLNAYAQRGDLDPKAKEQADTFRQLVPLRDEFVKSPPKSDLRAKGSYVKKVPDPNGGPAKTVRVITNATLGKDGQQTFGNEVSEIQDMEGNTLIRPGSSGDLRGLQTVANAIHSYVLEKPPTTPPPLGPTDKPTEQHKAYKNWEAGLVGAQGAATGKGSQLTKGAYSHAFSKIPQLPDREKVEGLVPTRPRRGIQVEM